MPINKSDIVWDETPQIDKGQISWEDEASGKKIPPADLYDEAQLTGIPESVAGMGQLARDAAPYLPAAGMMIGGAVAAPANIVAPGVSEVAGMAGGFTIGTWLQDLIEGKPTPLGKAAKDTATGLMIGMSGPITGKVIETTAGKIAPWLNQMAERVYASALKAPLSKKWLQRLPEKELSQRQAAVRAGVEGEVPISEYGIAVAKSLERETKSMVDDLISSGKQTGTVRVEDIIGSGLSKAYRRASKSSDPVAAKVTVDKIAERFRAHGEEVSVDKLNDIKRQLYREVKWTGTEATGLEGQMTEMSKKGLARAAKLKLEEKFPELKYLNEKDSAYINLIEALERQVGRQANRDLVGLDTKVLTRPHIWPLALINSAIGNSKAQIAFALRRAQNLKLKSLETFVPYSIAAEEGQEE